MYTVRLCAQLVLSFNAQHLPLTCTYLYKTFIYILLTPFFKTDYIFTTIVAHPKIFMPKKCGVKDATYKKKYLMMTVQDFISPFELQPPRSNKTLTYTSPPNLGHGADH